MSKDINIRLLEPQPNRRFMLAAEIHAKSFLLKHAKTFNLNQADKWFLELQLNRFKKYGLGRGY